MRCFIRKGGFILNVIVELGYFSVQVHHHFGNFDKLFNFALGTLWGEPFYDISIY